MAQLARHLGISRCLHIGHSMGVNVVLGLALRHPELVAGMVLISGTVLAPHDIMFNSNGMRMVFPLFRALCERFPEATGFLWRNNFRNPLFRRLIRHWGFGRGRVSDEFVRTYLRKVGEVDPEVFVRLFEEMESQNLLPHLREVRAPALVVSGSEDRIIPHGAQEVFLSNLPDAELFEVEGGGHAPQVEFGEEVNARIKAFHERLLDAQAPVLDE